MIVKITPTAEQQGLLETESESTVVIVDSQGNATHIGFPIKEARRILDEQLARELEIGFQQANCADWIDWDPEKIKAEGRRLRAERTQP
jgi:hypothetical protein